MGMYDNLLYQGKKYQTKNFECGMDDYILTDEGHLLRNVSGWSKEENYVDTHYHGIVTFYTIDQETWIEYTAKFTDGILVEIVKDTRPVGNSYQ